MRSGTSIGNDNKIFVSLREGGSAAGNGSFVTARIEDSLRGF